MKKFLIVRAFFAMTTVLFFMACAEDEFEHFGAIQGRITDISDNSPIENAIITLSPGGATRITNYDGRFEFLDLSPEQYTINISHPNFRSDRRTITVIIGESIEVNIQLAKEKE